MQHLPSAQPADDSYPSRGQCRSALRPRIDPVVYAAPSANAPLDSDRVERYRREGYLVMDDLFSATEVESLQAELQRLRSDPHLHESPLSITEPGSGALRSLFQVHRCNPLLRRLAADPRLADIARYLLDDEVYIHQSRVNYKPGFRGREFYWHSDFETWHVEDGMPRMRALSVSLTLTENVEQNGPLLVIPGSHRHFVQCEGDTPAEHYKKSLQQQEYGVPSDACLEQLVAEGGIRSVTGKPGSLILFDCNLMHGSNGNITPYPRSNLFLVYNALCNRVVAPFGTQPARPEYLSSRAQIEPLAAAPRFSLESV